MEISNARFRSVINFTMSCDNKLQRGAKYILVIFKQVSKYVQVTRVTMYNSVIRALDAKEAESYMENGGEQMLGSNVKVPPVGVCEIS